MTSLVDRVVTLGARAITPHVPPSASVRLLADARARAAASARARHQASAGVLAARADRGDRRADAEHGALAERALVEMRAAVLCEARGISQRLTARAHARFCDSETAELIDDPDLPPATRLRVLAALDSANALLGSYHLFFRAIEPLLVPGRETRILDLAAGHGGFGLELARIARARGIALTITATDVRPELVAAGEAAAAREGLPVRFAVQDALDLSNVAPGAHDVVVCTQSLHHFSAPMIARMFRQAARTAARGVVFIDGCRSVALGLAVPVLGVLRFGACYEIAHDAWVSFRRFYTPEELGLLASLGHPDGVVEATWMRPAHCVVRVRSDDAAQAS